MDMRQGKLSGFSAIHYGTDGKETGREVVDFTTWTESIYDASGALVESYPINRDGTRAEG